jgi:uncharacterized C2H2 Zn-finger protein
MKLQLGERLPGSGPPGQPGGYVVVDVVQETPWTTLYGARKILYNFDFANQRCRETDDKEWLNVLVRVAQVSDPDTPQSSARRRALARDEIRVVLANRTSNLWPEPVDLLELASIGESFAPGDEAGDDELQPVAVLARPHGESLDDWLKRKPSLAGRLALAAELLTFVGGAHADGLLLNGLGPAAFVVDQQGRVGYLASDWVLRLEQGRLADGTWPWADLFPPERYPRGFAAPECFGPGRPRDQRSDWHTWAALAYFVLTGDAPDRQTQADPWFHFQTTHAARLEKTLRSVSVAQVRTWAAALGVEPEACAGAWPRNLVRIVQRALAIEPVDRPGSVNDIFAWLKSPPPPAPLAALTLRVSASGTMRFCYEIAAADGALEAVVQQRLPATDLGDVKETVVAEGPATGWIEAPGSKGDEDGEYFIRLRVPGAGSEAMSEGTAAPLLEPVPRNLRQFVEAGAALAKVGDDEPPAVTLLCRAVRWIGVADAMLASTLPAVRAWATLRLAAAMDQAETAAAAEPLLWRAVRDNHAEIRKLAMRGWLSGALSAAGVSRLFEELAPRGTEEAGEALQYLRQRGGDVRLLRLAEEAVALAKNFACPECGGVFPQRDAPRHLQQVHGYLDVGGAVLPRAGALAQLWDRVFTEGDRNAHDRLCQLLSTPDSDGPPPYIGALATELERRADRLVAARWQELPRLTQCLRSNQKVVPLFARLLRASDRRVRDVGRDLLLGELTTRLTGTEITALHVRAELEELCPVDQLEDAIQLCRQLPQSGVKAEPVKECLRQLEQQRPVACPECSSKIPKIELEIHLRRTHRIYQFRGQQRTLQETLGVLLDKVCGKRSDHEAWITLESIAREEFPAEAEGYLATWLGQNLLRLSASQRDHRTGVAADAIAASSSGQRLAVVLAAMTVVDWQAAGFQLALEITLRLPTPVNAMVIAAIGPRLADKRLGNELRLRATAHLSRTTGPSGAGTNKLLRYLVASSGKVKNIERLHQLEQLTGKMPAIDQLCGELEDQVRMGCPRCDVELRRVEMTQHLWNEHRLMLDGRRVREPWRMIEDWLEDYRVEGDAEQLQRCRQLADQLDRKEGRARLQRLMLQHGIEDLQARGRLLQQAQDQHASLCPHCFNLVPVIDPRLPPELDCEPSLIEGNGYRVEISDNGLMPMLELEIPTGMLYDGREPRRFLTRLGALLFFAFPLMFAAIVLLLVPPDLGIAWFFPGAMALGLCLVVVGMILLGWDTPPDSLSRIVDLAWGRLVQQLLELGLARDDWAFLAGLAQCSIGHGDIAGRADTLEVVRGLMDERVTGGQVPASYLGALWRLTVEDGAEDEEGQDTVPLLAAQADRCFDGGLPLGFLSTLLAPLENEAWSVADERRLRVLLCQRAFDAGLEVRELLELGRLHGALHRALNLKHGEYIAHLRLLRTLQATRPWERVGKAATIFEIVRNVEASERLLDRFTDLLLRVDNVPGMYVCARGVLFEDAWILEPPQQIDIINRTLFAEGGFHLVIGAHTFWYAADPAPVVPRLEKWLRWFFQEFRPQLATVYRSRSPAAARRLVARNGVRCPDCRRRVLPVLGELGITADPPRREEGAVMALPR